MSEIEKNHKADQPKQMEQAVTEALRIVLGSHVAIFKDWLAQRPEVWSVNKQTVFSNKQDPETDAAYASSIIS